MSRLVNSVVRRIPFVRQLLRLFNTQNVLSHWLTSLDSAATTGPLRQLIGLQVEEHIARLLSSNEKFRDPRCLNRFESQVFSQCGDDGIIEEIFKRITPKSRYFVEIGVGDGLENNTTSLLWQNWRGCWIDGDDGHAKEIERTFRNQIADGTLSFKKALVTAENVEQVLRGQDVPQEFDLLSIDIDRNTYWVWKALGHFRPRVVVIEYNATLRPPIRWAVDYRPELTWNLSHYFGASLQTIADLGQEFGYSLVGCNLVGINAFFVRNDLCDERFSGPFTAEHHYEPPRFYLWPRRSMHPRCFSD